MDQIEGFVFANMVDSPALAALGAGEDEWLMTDIIIKPGDPRPYRWWGKPSPSKAYREGYDRIFGNKEKQDGEKEDQKKPDLRSRD